MASKKTIILSIDGGGVRGIIPAVILADLEKRLQALQDMEPGLKKEVRVADYFDIIAGTSAGSIVAALLTTPANGSDRPCPASSIISLFKDRSVEIFRRKPIKRKQIGKESILKRIGHFAYEWTFVKPWLFKYFINAQFDSSNIESFADELIRDLKLEDTLKHVIIPAYRTGNFGPYIFSSEEEKKNDHKVNLADVVLGSAAAPFYFLPHSFTLNGKFSSFTDGGMAAVNNPTMVALAEATRLHEGDYSKFMVLSLGTGIVKLPEEQDVHGGLYAWLLPFTWPTNKFWPVISMPRILQTLFNSTTTMTDIYMANIFSKFPSNYLRIQESDLDFNLGSLADTSPKNLNKLKEVGEKLLSKPVSITDTQTGDIIINDKSEPLIGDALQKFAESMFQQKKLCKKPDAKSRKVI